MANISYRQTKELVKTISINKERGPKRQVQKHEKIVLTNKLLEQSKEIERLQSRVNGLSSELHKLKSIPAKYDKVRYIK